MTDEWELRVRKMDAQSVREGVDGVYLECSEGRCGPFEPWMVRQITQEVRFLRRKRLDETADLLEEIATALERVLQEANNGKGQD